MVDCVFDSGVVDNLFITDSEGNHTPRKLEGNDLVAFIESIVYSDNFVDLMDIFKNIDDSRVLSRVVPALVQFAINSDPEGIAPQYLPFTWEELNEFSYINTFSDYQVSKNDFNYVYGIVLNDEIIGFIDYSIMYERAELNYIFIVDKYRRCGYSTLLMEYMIDMLKNKQVISITLEVRVDNYNAINLYKKFDFIEVGLRKKYYNGIDAILFSKHII